QRPLKEIRPVVRHPGLPQKLDAQSRVHKRPPRYPTQNTRVAQHICIEMKYSVGKPSRWSPVLERLVAESSADGDLMTPLGAAAAEHSGSGLGLHAGKEAVGLGPVTAVGVKRTLRHNKKTPAAGDSSCSNFSYSSNL